MYYSRGAKVSSLALCDTQSTPTRKRMSLVEVPFTSLKAKVSIFGKKSSNRRDTENQDSTSGNNLSRSGIDVNLPPRQSHVQFETSAREFPQNWQTSLGPRHSCLRRNSLQTQSVDTKHRRRSSQIWPTSLGSRSKFVRLIVVASPSLQRLSHRI